MDGNEKKYVKTSRWKKSAKKKKKKRGTQER